MASLPSGFVGCQMARATWTQRVTTDTKGTPIMRRRNKGSATFRLGENAISPDGAPAMLTL